VNYQLFQLYFFVNLIQVLHLMFHYFLRMLPKINFISYFFFIFINSLNIQLRKDVDDQFENGIDFLLKQMKKNVMLGALILLFILIDFSFYYNQFISFFFLSFFFLVENRKNSQPCLIAQSFNKLIASIPTDENILIYRCGISHAYYLSFFSLIDKKLDSSCNDILFNYFRLVTYRVNLIRL